MRLDAGFSAVFLLSVVITVQCDPEYCNRGFQISSKYHQCWEQATYAHKYPPLYEQHEEYGADLVEGYASHMCSVVKPVALECLREEVKDCSNADKLVETADESGGACVKDHLNPFFKFHIIDHLVPVKADSECFAIADSSYECYEAAGNSIMSSGANMVDISKFHKVADKFFSSIWDCLITIFKSNSEVCQNWQIPMLLALQKTAMPSLFGMRLTNDQVAKLELRGSRPTTPRTNGGTTPSPENCEGDSDRFYIMLKVLIKKPVNFEGDLLLQVDQEGGQKPEISVAQTSNAELNKDVTDFVGQITEKKKEMTLKEIRQFRKEQRKKNKEIENYLKQIKIAERRRKNQNKPNGNRKKPYKKGNGKPNVDSDIIMEDVE